MVLRDRKAMHLPEIHFRMNEKNTINTSSTAKRMLTDQEPCRYGMEAGVRIYMIMWVHEKNLVGIPGLINPLISALFSEESVQGMRWKCKKQQRGSPLSVRNVFPA